MLKSFRLVSCILWCSLCTQQLQHQESSFSENTDSGTDDVSLEGDADALDHNITGFIKLKNVLATVFQALTELSSNAAVVWILDDVQWMDEASKEIQFVGDYENIMYLHDAGSLAQQIGVM